MKRGRAKVPPYQAWLNNYRVASEWIAKRDVERAVDANGGLVRIDNFLPEFVAEGILATIEAIPEEKWNDTSAKQDYTQNNISHSFSSVKQADGLDAVTRLFSLIRPSALCAFSAARYCKADHIDPHDDRAYTQVRLDSGRVITTSRTLAVIYYLTRDWTEQLGGVLLDLEDPAAQPPGAPTRYVPRWNSVVAFRVPRYHAVTPMATQRPRYSIFGWFLEPGELYPLFRGGDVGPAATQAGNAGRGAAAAKKLKRKLQQEQQQEEGQEQGQEQRQGGPCCGEDGDKEAEAQGGGATAEEARKRRRQQRQDGSAEAPEPHEGMPYSHKRPHTKRLIRGVGTCERPPEASTANGCGGGEAAAPASQSRKARWGPRQEGEQGREAEELGGGGSQAEAGSGGDLRNAVAAQDGTECPGPECCSRKPEDGPGRSSHPQEGRQVGVAPGDHYTRLRLPGRWQGRRKHVCVG